MPSVLKTVGNETISNRIRDVSITPNMTKITNILLDGSFHIQSLGKPYFVVSIVCELDQAHKKILDRVYINDEPLRFESEGGYHEGLLMKQPSINNHIVNSKIKRYVATLDMISYEEG